MLPLSLPLAAVLLLAFRFWPLSRRQRYVARSVARDVYVMRPELRDRPEMLRDTLRRKLAADASYRSLVASLLVSLAVRLAVELIHHWIESRVAKPRLGHFQRDEPGF